MEENKIRIPVQKRSIEKKEKIIEAGFALFCQYGYYHINTAEIAKAAGVSTGIVYNYFKDKHDILMEGLQLHAGSIFYPMLNTIMSTPFEKENLAIVLKQMIQEFIENHKLSKTAHEEITSMIHSDHEIASLYHEYEMKITEEISAFFIENGFKDTSLKEKIHIALGMIDHLCHEIVYHKHKNMNYQLMIDCVIHAIVQILS